MKMNSFIHICFFSLFVVFPNRALSNVIGSAGCDCYGEMILAMNLPKEVPIESFPKECTSLLYNCLLINPDLTMEDPTLETLGIEGYLDKLIATGKNVILYYGRLKLKEWVDALACDPITGELVAKGEIKNLQKFLDQHKGIKGLGIFGLDMHDDSVDFPGFTDQFQKYIEMLHSAFPDLEIGLCLFAAPAIEYYKNPSKTWLDFKRLDSLIDFYILNMMALNECTAQLVQSGGIYPLTGNGANTVDMARTSLEKAGVTMSKFFYCYILMPVPIDPKAFSLQDTFYPSFCKGPKEWKSYMCTDTIQSLTEKGKYAKDNGAGFIIKSIDFDDADGCSCKCGRSFPGFYALLDGYNGSPPSPSCSLFDKT